MSSGRPRRSRTALRASLVDGLGLKPKNAFGPVRVAITGRRVSPPLFESMELLGRDRTLARLAPALATLGSTAQRTRPAAGPGCSARPAAVSPWITGTPSGRDRVNSSWSALGGGTVKLKSSVHITGVPSA